MINLTSCAVAKGTTGDHTVLLIGSSQAGIDAWVRLMGVEIATWEASNSLSFGDLTEFLWKEPPDLALINATATGGECDLLGLIHRLPAGLPVVVFGADVVEDHRAALLDAGAAEVISGTPDGEQIRTTIGHVLVHAAPIGDTAMRLGDPSPGGIPGEGRLDMPVAILRTAPDGSILWANNSAVGILGYPDRDALLGTNISELWVDTAARERAEEEMFRSGSSGAITFEFRHFTGRTIWLQGSARVHFDPEGEPRCVEAVVIDVTERIHALETMAEAQEIAASFFVRTPVPYLIEDFSALRAWLARLRANGIIDIRSYLAGNPDEVRFAVGLIRIVGGNPSAVQLLGGHDESQILGPIPEDSVTDEALPVWTEQIVAAWENRTSLTAEGRGVTFEGQPFEFVLTWVVASGGEGDLGRVIVSLSDVTRLRESQRALLRSEERLRRFVAAAPVGLMEFDATALKQAVDTLAESGVADVRQHLSEHPRRAVQLLSRLRTVTMNPAAQRILRCGETPEALPPELAPQETAGEVVEALWTGGLPVTVESRIPVKYGNGQIGGTRLLVSWADLNGDTGSIPSSVAVTFTPVGGVAPEWEESRDSESTLASWKHVVEEPR